MVFSWILFGIGMAKLIWSAFKDEDGSGFLESMQFISMGMLVAIPFLMER